MIDASNLAKAEATDIGVGQHAFELPQEPAAVMLPFRAQDGRTVEAYIGHGRASCPRHRPFRSWHSVRLLPEEVRIALAQELTTLIMYIVPLGLQMTNETVIATVG